MATAGLHAAETIAKFLGYRETRLIAAAYRDPARAGELYVLPHGDADARRAWAKQELRCMIPDCERPDLTTVSRPRYRDGFRHRPGAGGHAPESVNHLQGKAVVEQWLRATYPDARVEVEHATDTQRSNVADIMLLLPTGARVAFEVQYADLTAAEWRRRHDSYVAQGIIDVWLWGHNRVLKNYGGSSLSPFRLSEAQEEARSLGQRVFFINPITAQVGVAAGYWREQHCLAFGREYDLAVCDFTGVRAAGEGLTSGLFSELAHVSHVREHTEAREELERKRRLEDQREKEAKEARERALEKGVMVNSSLTEVMHRRSEEAERNDGRPRCIFCQEVLDEIYYKKGYHVGFCGPGMSLYRRW